MKSKSLLTILAGIFVAASLADILLTWRVVQAGGSEVNPVIGAVISAGWPLAITLKVLLPAVIAIALVRRRRLAMLAILAVAFTLLMFWNIVGVLV